MLCSIDANNKRKKNKVLFYPILPSARKKNFASEYELRCDHRTKKSKAAWEFRHARPKLRTQWNGIFDFLIKSPKISQPLSFPWKCEWESGT